MERRQFFHTPDTMENNEEDNDVKLARASAGLLADLEASLPKLLWKTSRTSSAERRFHSCVRRRDLDYVLNLVCPISGIVLSQSSRVAIDRTISGRATSSGRQTQNCLATHRRCLPRVIAQAHHSQKCSPHRHANCSGFDLVHFVQSQRREDHRRLLQQ